MATNSPGVRQQRTDAGDRPFIVIWEATRACPLACRHCRASAQPDRSPFELTSVEAAALIDDVAAFGAPPPLFVITGGDPFQRPDLFDLVRRATAAGLPVAVSPSGTPTLTAAALAALHDAGARAVSLSVDASTADAHDAFRQVDGVFDLTLAAWRAAREIGLRVQVNTTVGRHNIHDLPNIARLVAELGAMTWSGFLLVPTGRGAALEELTPSEVEDVLNWLYDVGVVVPTKTTEAHHFRRIVVQRRILDDHGLDHVRALRLGPLYDELSARTAELGLTALARRRRRPPMDVNAGRGFVFVSHVGTVHPSGFLPMPAGNVRDESLQRIYRDSALFAGLRDLTRLGGRCGRCEFAVICGGSRSRSYAVTGDPFAEEPWCSYEPGSFGFDDDVAALVGARPQPA